MVSLFAFIHFCSLLISVSANLSSWLKLFPDMKQFVSSANSFIIILSSDLWISLINNKIILVLIQTPEGLHSH